MKPLMLTPFTDFKGRLIAVPCGERRRSNLLKELRALSGSRMPESFLREMFLQRLPDQVSTILAATGYSLDMQKLAVLPDKVMETAQFAWYSQAHSIVTYCVAFLSHSMVNPLSHPLL